MPDAANKIGIVGCGSIGAGIARAIDGGSLKAELFGVCDADSAMAVALVSSLKKKPAILPLAELVAGSDIVVECAAGSAVEGVADECLRQGKDLMVMSVGGLTAGLLSRFEESSSNLYVPSGAVCGIDGVLAASMAGIESLSLTTRKPPAGLAGAPYLEENGISLEGLVGEKIVFEGSPEDAIRGFPKNVNVSTTLALASAAGDRFIVRIVADPESSGNAHEIEMRGAAGTVHIRVDNVPSAQNPRTSALAYYSAIALLGKILSRVKIGT